MTTAPVLTTSVRIAAPPAAIFPYLIDPALIVEWIGDWADLDPQPGGTFAVDIEKTPVRGEYVEVDPPHRVVFTWGVPGRDGLPPGSTTVEIVLTEDGAETLVELFHHNLPTDEFESHLEGWISKLGGLTRLFEKRL
ncbi:MAG TPA: SRPBCC domain-containing protein [Mycobacteriales bacterium]|nr:SRPBCC domain-containing protein [Mycobacteriales bacterium]